MKNKIRSSSSISWSFSFIYFIELSVKTALRSAPIAFIPRSRDHTLRTMAKKSVKSVLSENFTQKSLFPCSRVLAPPYGHHTTCRSRKNASLLDFGQIFFWCRVLRSVHRRIRSGDVASGSESFAGKLSWTWGWPAWTKLDRYTNLNTWGLWWGGGPADRRLLCCSSV